MCKSLKGRRLSFPEEVALIASLRAPVVLLEDPAPAGRRPEGSPLSSAPCVRMDSRGVGRMAADYFLARGYTSFAYVDETQGLFWSAERREGFAESVRAAGFPCAVFGGPFTARERAHWSAERPRMMRFLLSLPRPTAILAAMDGRARLVLEACSAAKLRVPEEIAVLGVDDDPLLCEAPRRPRPCLRPVGRPALPTPRPCRPGTSRPSGRGSASGRVRSVHSRTSVAPIGREARSVSPGARTTGAGAGRNGMSACWRPSGSVQRLKPSALSSSERAP